MNTDHLDKAPPLSLAEKAHEKILNKLLTADCILESCLDHVLKNDHYAFLRALELYNNAFTLALDSDCLSATLPDFEERAKRIRGIIDEAKKHDVNNLSVGKIFCGQVKIAVRMVKAKQIKDLDTQ